MSNESVRTIIDAANAADERYDQLCSELAKTQVALEATSQVSPAAPEEKFKAALDLQTQRDNLVARLIEAWNAKAEAGRNLDGLMQGKPNR